MSGPLAEASGNDSKQWQRAKIEGLSDLKQMRSGGELTIRYDPHGFQDNTATIGFDPLSIACDRDNDIPGQERASWERRHPACCNKTYSRASARPSLTSNL
jgi:hypothetical protein